MPKWPFDTNLGIFIWPIFGSVSLQQEKPYIKMKSTGSFCTTRSLKAKISISTTQFEFSEWLRLKEVQSALEPR